MKNKKKMYSRFLTIALAFLFSVLISSPAQASDVEESEKKAVVFLLDASGSMTGNDPNRYAIDSIAQLIYTLPTNYEVGFVAYNSDVCTLQGFLGNSQRNRIMDAADSVEYKGYSNAGAGLDAAVGMLESAAADEREIILLSDGEIFMEDEETTSQSQKA